MEANFPVHIFHAIVISKSEYGIAVLSSASQRNLEILDPIYTAVLRLVTIDFRTRVKQCNFVEAGEPPPNVCRIISTSNLHCSVSASLTLSYYDDVVTFAFGKMYQSIV